MIIQSNKGVGVSPAMEELVDHTIDDDAQNVEESPFHIRTNSEQSSLKVKLASGDDVILGNYNNDTLLLVTKVYSTDTTTPGDIVCFR